MLDLFRWLLRLLPPDVRRAYGDEMLEVVRSQRAEVAGDSRWPVVRFWTRQLWALVRAAVALRRAESERPNGHDADALVTTEGRGMLREGTGDGGGMDGFVYDVRQTLRGLRRRPGFVVVTAMTLGLGIGASTAIFSAVHAVLFRDLPYGEPERIVALFHEDAETGERGSGLSPANARDIFESSELLTAAAVAEPWSLDLLVDGRAHALRVWAVSEGFFEALGVEPLHGRSFTPQEYAGTGGPVALLGHRSWLNRFGGDPGLVGETLTFQQGEVTVVGILGPGFKLPDEAELWVPRWPQERDGYERGADYMTGVGRIRPGATLEQAQSELHRIAESLGELHPETNASLTFRAVPLREHLLGDVRTPLLVLLAAVGLVLVIACGNVAGLMLARGARRQREYALRGALGAGSRRLVRQILAESGALATLGCILGVALAYLGIDLVARLGPEHLPRIDELSVDGTVLGFAVAVSGVGALLSGIFPALRLSRPDLAEVLSDGSRSATRGPGSFRLRNRLVVVEIAAAVVLLVGAGLLSRSLTILLDEELGFDPTNRLAVQVFAYDGYDGAEDRSAFIRQAMDNIRAIPGVDDVALTSSVPSATDGILASIDIDLRFTIADRPSPPAGQEPVAAISQVSAGFFDVLDMSIVDGRGFHPSDDRDSPMVIVVNEALARRHFGDRSPVGEQLNIGYQPVPREIVGVVGDVRPQGHESEPRPEVYFPLSQFGTGSLTFVAKASVDAATLIQPAMDAIWEANPAQSIWGASTVDDLLSDWLDERAFNLLLMGSLAAIALVLAGIGVYGLVSFSVEQRVPEMGVRRALGGGAGAILGLVLGEGARLAATGLALGLVAAYPLTRFIQGMLHRVDALDPVVLTGLVVLVMTVASLAALVPALRAVRADPMRVLRTE